MRLEQKRQYCGIYRAYIATRTARAAEVELTDDIKLLLRTACDWTGRIIYYNYYKYPM